ncbi:MAG: Asp-tRNA(Asn)/Glu-tRNA(Gln) amidotransferase subunit GatC [Bacteroidetes bacterium]|jgi:aspartyl-tRNA(Asn)/glutamyl-tRNA(Gln) amidotransferase subunit C|nr:Asp-tRNA(Asn)/Glu-tRNA(Gln) amidotransferase subunit GatC [Bacteroidota bacterium]
MDINNETIDRLAELAKLEFSIIEKESLKKDLNSIISYFEKLNEVNTDNVEPLIFMTDEVNRLREDVVIQNTSKQEALLNAPAKDSDYFRVPKVLDK